MDPIEELLTFYRSILHFAGLQADEEGYVRIIGDADRSIFTVNGKSLVLPTLKHLRSPAPDHKVVFHPLAEDITNGESAVLKELKRVVNVKLNQRFGVIGLHLLKLVAEPRRHPNLSREQREVIADIQTADETTAKNWASHFVTLIQTKPDRGYLNIHLRRGGTFQGKQHARVSLTTFPYFRELQKDNGEIGKIRKTKDIPTYVELYRAMLPELDNIEAYNAAAPATVAPFLSVLLQSARMLAVRFNELVDLFKEDMLGDYDDIYSDLGWVDGITHIDNLVHLIRAVPMQEGNNGEQVPTQQGPAAQQVAEPIAAVPVAPVPQTQLPPAPPPVAPVWPTAPPQAAYYPPVPAPASPSGGLNWKKAVRDNPGAGYGPNPLGHVLEQQAFEQALAQWNDHYARMGMIPPPFPGLAQQGHPPPVYNQPPPGYPAPGYPPAGYPQHPPAAYPPVYPPGYVPPGYGYPPPGYPPR